MILKQKKTFTLIEMLIVIVIIGILAAALVPRLQSLQTRARNTQRRVAVRQISDGVRIHFFDRTRFPENLLHLIGSGFLTTVPLDPRIPNNDPCDLVSHGWVMTGSSTGLYTPTASQNYGFLYIKTDTAVNGTKYGLIAARMENDGGINSHTIYGGLGYTTGIQLSCVTNTVGGFEGFQSRAIDGSSGWGMSIAAAIKNAAPSSKTGWLIELIEQ